MMGQVGGMIVSQSTIECPKCGFEQPNNEECVACGVIVARFKPPPKPLPLHEKYKSLDLLVSRDRFFIEQPVLSWSELLLNWEIAKKYLVRDEKNRSVGLLSEHSKGVLAILRRLLLGSHRPLEIDVYAYHNQSVVLHLDRGFFWFHSDLFVFAADGARLGSVHRRFNPFVRVYDLVNQKGRVFAQIRSPFWRWWTFPLLDMNGQRFGVISKKWGGLFREWATDSDDFLVDVGTFAKSLDEQAVLFAAAISVDFDFFENNHK